MDSESRYVARAALINYFYHYLGVKTLYFKKPLQQWEMIAAGVGLTYQAYGLYNLKPKNVDEVATDLYTIGIGTVMTPLFVTTNPKKFVDQVILGLE